MQVQVTSSDGQVVGVIALDAKTFNSGSKGYFGQTKLEAAGKRYQCQCQLVEIHSKPAPKATK